MKSTWQVPSSFRNNSNFSRHWYYLLPTVGICWRGQFFPTLCLVLQCTKFNFLIKYLHNSSSQQSLWCVQKCGFLVTQLKTPCQGEKCFLWVHTTHNNQQQIIDVNVLFWFWCLLAYCRLVRALAQSFGAVYCKIIHHKQITANLTTCQIILNWAHGIVQLSHPLAKHQATSALTSSPWDKCTDPFPSKCVRPSSANKQSNNLKTW